MKGVYLASGRALHEGYEIDYQDINGKRDIGGDMLDVDLSLYDFIIATPPCNFYTRANYRRYSSRYAQLTKMLLPIIIEKCIKSGKPFIVENVRNYPLMKKMGLFDFGCFVYFIGRHTYWTNILMSTDVPQRQDFVHHGILIKYDDMEDTYHQGGYNVHQVVDLFLKNVVL